MGTTDLALDHHDPVAAGALRDIDPDDVVDEFARRGLDRLSDAALLAAAADIVDGRLVDAPDSFLLHAPLELLARATLLQQCSPAVREAARKRLVWVAACFERDGRPGDPAGAGAVPVDEADAVRRLSAAIAAGELDDAAAAGRWLGQHVDADRLAGLVGDLLVPSLAAAAHGPIFLHLLPRIASRIPQAGAMLGNLAREVAREPTWRLTWIDERPTPTSDFQPLGDALADVPVLGLPGSAFIHPLMRQAEVSGLAASVGASLDPDLGRATRTLLRIATESMLRDDPAHAPYGWSHCLTLPQAVLSIAPQLDDPDLAVAVAATYVTGFRTALGQAPLRMLREEAAADDRGATDPTEPGDELRRVVDKAAVHPDAHLAKYVVACIDAARSDPGFAGQHLAAAGHLARWWHEQPPAADPIVDATRGSSPGR